MPVAVITGGTSFIGIALAKELIAHGYECYSIARPGNTRIALLPRNNKRLHVIEEDLFNENAWKAQIPACDVFFHLGWGGVGAQGRGDASIQKRNLVLSRQCMYAAAQLGAKRFLFAGSQAEYGNHQGKINEETMCNPITEYGKAKYEFLSIGTILSEQLKMEYVHLRIFSVYGPYDHPWALIHQCIETLARGEKIELSPCTQMWNYVYVSDAAAAIRMMSECALDQDASPIYHIAGEDTRILRSFVDEIWRLMGCQGSLGYGERKGAEEKPHGIEPVMDKTRKATGWHQKVVFSEGIRQVIASMEE